MESLHNPAIIVMVKAPREGQAKTRLCPAISPALAASLAAAFFQDTVALARSACRNVLVAYTPSDGRSTLEALAFPDVGWVDQGYGSLGDRMQRSIDHAARLGHAPILVIGTDSPTLPASVLSAALDRLQTHDEVVLGPTEDGGYYLLGLRAPVSGLLSDIEWSTEHVYDQTVQNVSRLGLSVCDLPVWYDVDVVDDLRRLVDNLRRDPEARESAPATWRWVAENARLL